MRGLDSTLYGSALTLAGTFWYPTRYFAYRSGVEFGGDALVVGVGIGVCTLAVVSDLDDREERPEADDPSE